MALTASQYLNIIKEHKRQHASDKKRFDRNRRSYLGQFWGKADEQRPQGAGEESSPDEEMVFDKNYTYAYVDTLVAHVCPANPEVDIHARSEENSAGARVRQAYGNDVLYRHHAHELLWKIVTQTSVYGWSWMKAVWRSDRNDVQYMVVDPRTVWFDHTAESFEDIRYLIEVTAVTKEDFDAKVANGTYDAEVAKEADPKKYPQWLVEAKNSPWTDGQNDAAREVFDWVVVYEVYDFSKTEPKFYALLDGCDKPLLEDRLPYPTLKCPYYLIRFNDNMQDLRGIADVDLIYQQQRVLNELNTLKLWHALSSIPVGILQDGFLTDPEAFLSALMNVSGPGEYVKLGSQKPVPVQHIIGTTPTPTLMPEWQQMEEQCMQAIEMQLALPRFSRGEVGVVDVATEAMLADTAVRTRNSRRQKAVYDLVVWMVKAAISLFAQYATPDETIPLRLIDENGTRRASIEMMKIERERFIKGEDALDYDYEARPFNAPENNRVVQLKLIRENQDMITMGIQSGALDPVAYFRWFAELMMMPGNVVTGKMQNPDALRQMGRAPNPEALVGGELPPTEMEPDNAGGGETMLGGQIGGLAG